MVGPVLPVSSFIVSLSYNHHTTQDALENIRTQYVYCCWRDFINTLPQHFIFSGSLSAINSNVRVVTGKKLATPVRGGDRNLCFDTVGRA
jgi:hypothetical protein